MMATKRNRVRVTITQDPDVLAWLDGAAEAWGLSRSATVELSVRTLRRVIEGLAVVTETRESRALAALRSLELGEVPPLVDLRALAEMFQEPEEAP